MSVRPGLPSLSARSQPKRVAQIPRVNKPLSAREHLRMAQPPAPAPPPANSMAPLHMLAPRPG